MKYIPCAQGGEEWKMARLGKVTASEMEAIITPVKWELTSGIARRSYQLRLLTELILDAPLETSTTPAMLHGTDTEKRALRAYEMTYGVDAEECGFYTTDDGLVGASPDAFIGEEGSLEIKSPFNPDIHVGYLLNPESLVKKYWVQVQGQLYVTGRKWTDIISYFSGIPMAQVRVTPDEKFQKALDGALKIFLCELTDLIELARKRGVRFRAEERKDAPAMPRRDWISEEDLDEILAARRAK